MEDGTLMKFRLVLGVAFWLALSSANGEMLTFEFSGSVTQVPVDEVFGDIAFGDAVKGTFQFDASAVDLVANPAIGSYFWSAPFGLTFTIGTHDFDATGQLHIGVFNSFVDQYTVSGTSPGGEVEMGLFFQDNSGSVFPDDSLPLVLPPLAKFDQADFHFGALFAGREAQVDGRLIETVVQPVPELSSAALLLTGNSLCACRP
jgi:hypothetical protein